MRLIGAGLVILAGLSCGLSLAKDYRGRLDGCRSLCRMLERMELELTHFCTPLPELFEKLEEGGAQPLCGAVRAGIEAGGGFAAVWQEALTALPMTERDILTPLGTILGRYGAAEQAAAVAACLARMRGMCEELEAARAEKARVAVGLCAGTGMMLAVLLL